MKLRKCTDLKLVCGQNCQMLWLFLDLPLIRRCTMQQCTMNQVPGGQTKEWIKGKIARRPGLSPRHRSLVDPQYQVVDRGFDQANQGTQDHRGSRGVE